MVKQGPVIAGVVSFVLVQLSDFRFCFVSLFFSDEKEGLE